MRLLYVSHTDKILKPTVKKLLLYQFTFNRFIFKIFLLLFSMAVLPNPQPQQHLIRAGSATYAAVCGYARSLTHWARPGIEPQSSQRQIRFLTCWAIIGTPAFNAFNYPMEQISIWSDYVLNNCPQFNLFLLNRDQIEGTKSSAVILSNYHLITVFHTHGIYSVFGFPLS